MHLNNQSLKSIQTEVLDDFAYILGETRKLANTSLLDLEYSVLQHVYLNKAEAKSLEADMRLMIPELKNLSNKLQELLAKTDEMTENLSKYLGD